MSTPIGLSNDQIAEMLRLVQADMTAYLGYPVIVKDYSTKGQDIKPRLYDVKDADFNDVTREYFSNRCFSRFCEVAKLHGE